MRWQAAHIGSWGAAGLLASLTWLLSSRRGDQPWQDDLAILLWAAGTALVALLLALPMHLADRRAGLRSAVATLIIAVVTVAAAAGLAALLGQYALLAGATVAAALAGHLAHWWMAGRRPGRHGLLSLAATLDAAVLLLAVWLLLPLHDAARWAAFTACGGLAFALNGAAVAAWAQPFQPPARVAAP